MWSAASGLPPLAAALSDPGVKLSLPDASHPPTICPPPTEAGGQDATSLPVFVSEFTAPSLQLPPLATAYFCVPIWLPPDLTAAPALAVGFEAVLNLSSPAGSGLVQLHHYILLRCSGPLPDLQGPECFKMPLTCWQVLYMWAPGAEPVTLPRGTGFPVGAGSGVSGLLLQMHYTNPANVSGAVDNSGVRIRWTGVPRGAQEERVLYSGGMANLFGGGAAPPGLPAFFDTHACLVTTRAPLRVTKVSFHAHRTARLIWVDVFRWDSQKRAVAHVGQLARVEAFDFEHQHRYDVPDVALYDGDMVSATCVYDTRSRAGPTRGGDSTEDEMCNAYLWASGPLGLNGNCLRLDVGGTTVASAWGPMPGHRVASSLTLYSLHNSSMLPGSVMKNAETLGAFLARVAREGASAVVRQICINRSKSTVAGEQLLLRCEARSERRGANHFAPASEGFGASVAAAKGYS